MQKPRMRDEERTQIELLDELTGLREKVAELEDRVRKCTQSEKTVQEEKRLTDVALDTQLDTFFVFEIDTGKALRWNRAFRDISGYSDEQIYAMKAPDAYYSPEDLAKAQRAIHMVQSQGQTVVELSLLTRDGARFPRNMPCRAFKTRKDGQKPHCRREKYQFTQAVRKSLASQ